MLGTKPRTESPPKTAPRDYAGLCGLYWEGDAAYETSPGGCRGQEQNGARNVCPVYACAAQRGVAHCGVCPDFPCLLLVSLAAEGGPDDPRIESAALRANVGEERWTEWARRHLRHRGFCPLWRRRAPP